MSEKNRRAGNKTKANFSFKKGVTMRDHSLEVINEFFKKVAKEKKRKSAYNYRVDKFGHKRQKKQKNKRLKTLKLL